MLGKGQGLLLFFWSCCGWGRRRGWVLRLFSSRGVLGQLSFSTQERRSVWGWGWAGRTGSILEAEVLSLMYPWAFLDEPWSYLCGKARDCQVRGHVVLTKKPDPGCRCYLGSRQQWNPRWSPGNWLWPPRMASSVRRGDLDAEGHSL